MVVKFVIMPPQRELTRMWAARITDTIPEMTVALPESEDEARRELVDADAAFGTIPPSLLAVASRLRWLQAPAAAPPAGYYYDELIEHPVAITNFRGIYNDHISAHIMAYVLMFARGMHVYFPQQLRRVWKPDRDEAGTVYLPEATALVVGLGGIGGEAARHCKHFGMRVLAVDARRDDTPEWVDDMRRPEALDELLPEADFVIMTVPHTPATEGLMNSDRFRLMKRSAFLINIGRGMTVKLDHLVEALRGREIAGAALDVFEIEPLPADHPLWGLPNVILTPHTAAFGPYLEERRTEIVLDNCRRFVSGRPLRNVVDKKNWF